MADLRKSIRSSLKMGSNKDLAVKEDVPVASDDGKSVLANKLSKLAVQIGYMGAS